MNKQKQNKTKTSKRHTQQKGTIIVWVFSGLVMYLCMLNIGAHINITVEKIDDRVACCPLQ